MLTLPCSLPHVPSAPKAEPQQVTGSVPTSIETLSTMVGSMHSPPKFQPSVPVTWRPASHFRSLPDPGSLVTEQARTLQGACSVLPPPSALFPASPELSPCSQPCAGDTHALQHVYIHTYIKNTYCNLHILVLSCWFIYAQEICLHLCLPQCRSLGFPHGGLPSTAMSIYRTLPKVPVRPVQMTPAAPVLPRGISSVFQSQTPFFLLYL